MFPISLNISWYIWIPSNNLFLFMNSSSPCNNKGVLFIGVNPNAGIPISRINLLSAVAGLVIGLIFNFLKAIEILT